MDLNELIVMNLISGLTDHAEIEAKSRGFTEEAIEKIILEGTMEMGKSKYGTDQKRYTLQRNTVVVDYSNGKNHLKIITLFSDDNFNSGKFIPFSHP